MPECYGNQWKCINTYSLDLASFESLQHRSGPPGSLVEFKLRHSTPSWGRRSSSSHSSPICLCNLLLFEAGCLRLPPPTVIVTSNYDVANHWVDEHILGPLAARQRCLVEERAAAVDRLEQLREVTEAEKKRIRKKYLRYGSKEREVELRQQRNRRHHQDHSTAHASSSREGHELEKRMRLLRKLTARLERASSAAALDTSQVKLAVGFDTEHRQALRWGGPCIIGEGSPGADSSKQSSDHKQASGSRGGPQLAVLQLAVVKSVLLFQWNGGGSATASLPPQCALRKALESSNVLKVGIALESDLAVVGQALRIRMKGAVDLRDCGTSGFGDLLKNVFGFRLDKSSIARIRNGNWTSSLSADQVSYAASDAWVPIVAFSLLTSRFRGLMELGTAATPQLLGSLQAEVTLDPRGPLATWRKAHNRLLLQTLRRSEFRRQLKLELRCLSHAAHSCCNFGSPSVSPSPPLHASQRLFRAALSSTLPARSKIDRGCFRDGEPTCAREHVIDGAAAKQDWFPIVGGYCSSRVGDGSHESTRKYVSRRDSQWQTSDRSRSDRRRQRQRVHQSPSCSSDYVEGLDILVPPESLHTTRPTWEAPPMVRSTYNRNQSYVTRTAGAPVGSECLESTADVESQTSGLAGLDPATSSSAEDCSPRDNIKADLASSRSTVSATEALPQREAGHGSKPMTPAVELFWPIVRELVPSLLTLLSELNYWLPPLGDIEWEASSLFAPVIDHTERSQMHPGLGQQLLDAELRVLALQEAIGASGECPSGLWSLCRVKERHLAGMPCLLRLAWLQMFVFEFDLVPNDPDIWILRWIWYQKAMSLRNWLELGRDAQHQLIFGSIPSQDHRVVVQGE